MIGTPLTGWSRMFALGVTGFVLGGVISGGTGLGLGVRQKIVTYPLAYELPKIPGGTSLRMAMIHDVLLERYLRHGAAWYEERNASSRRVIDEERAKPGQPTARLYDAMDDLAVGLENLHQSAAAAAVMREKLTLLPEVPAAVFRQDHVTGNARYADPLDELRRIKAASRLSPEMHQQYTVRANLGTSLIHGAFRDFLTGDAAARNSLVEGVGFIEQSIAINPAAHFGRENWQAIVVRYFLACRERPELLTKYDMVGDDLALIEPTEYRRRYHNLSAPALWLDVHATDDERVGGRLLIARLRPSEEWISAVSPRDDTEVPFDEPVLALLGMWMLGGGPSPHSAMALANISMQVGQWEIAWDGYERAIEMQEGFSPDANVRGALVDYCKKQQGAIAEAEMPGSADAWTAKTRQRHASELSWARQYQNDYHDWEAKQIAAGVGLDDPGFYDGFFKNRPSIASPVGHVDEVAIRYFAPDGVLDALPGALLLGGLCVFFGGLSAKRA